MSDSPTPGPPRLPLAGQPVLGTIVLFCGTALLFLAIIDSAYGLPAAPRFWYVNRSLWWLIAVALMMAGAFLLRRPPASARSWRPSRAGVRFRRLVLYTRQECSLCDTAHAQLAQLGEYLPPIMLTDVDRDPRLIERFGTCVPVVEIDGKVRFRGRINDVLLRRLIEATPPRAS